MDKINPDLLLPISVILESNCDREREFQCEDNKCVSWDKVCNLENDCMNGRDEDPKICGKILFQRTSVPNAKLNSFPARFDIIRK